MIDFNSWFIYERKDWINIFNIKIEKENLLYSGDLGFMIFHLLNILDILNTEQFYWHKFFLN